MHDIELKTEDPIYIKQFRIQEAQREGVQKHSEELLKLGVVKPSRSKFNSPIFVVNKKGWRNENRSRLPGHQPEHARGQVLYARCPRMH